MSVAAEKLLPASERFSLVRLRPARWITGDLESLGSSLYSYSFGFAIAFASLEYNGSTSTLTKVTGTPDADGEYNVDESTGKITLYLDSAPDSDDDHFVAYHYLFLTEKEYRYLPEDPSDSDATVREWQPRLLSAPAVTQSLKNLRQGLLTFDDTQVDAANTDAYFQDYLTADDSFYNAEIVIWQAITDTSNLQRVFTGKVSGVSGARESVSFSAFETLYAMNQPADFGGGAGTFTWLDSDMFPGHFGLPRHLILGASSWYETIDYQDSEFEKLISAGNKAVSLSYSAAISGTTNRSWGLGMINGNVPTQSFGAIEAVSTGVTGFIFVRFASHANLKIGDTFCWTESGTVGYGNICYTESFTYDGTSYNCAAVVVSPFGATSFSTSSTMNAKKSVGLFVGGVTLAGNPINFLIPLCLGRDFSLNEAIDSDTGLRKLEAVLLDDAEFDAFGYTDAGANTPFAVDPNQHDVLYRVSSDAALTHGTVAKLLLEQAGLTVNAASVTAANAALTDTVNFSIPSVDETEVQSYATYLGELLRSALAYIAVNASGEVEYHLLAAPSSTDARDTNLRLLGGTTFQVEYQDILHGLRYRNPHLPGGSSATIVTDDYDDRAKYLYGVTASAEYRHCLELSSATLSRHAKLKAILSRPRTVYGYEVATEDIDTTLGDDVLLKSKIVLGGDGSKAVKVITLAKQTGKVQVEAEDLEGLT